MYRDEQRICILGAGSWGTALAHLLGNKEYQVTLWDRNQQITEHITQHGHNSKYLPDIALATTVSATSDMEAALKEANWVIVAVASDGIREVLEEAVNHVSESAIVISACKGLEAETGMTMSDIIESLFSDISYSGLCVLSGPNLAGELAQGIPAASVIASLDPQVARAAQDLLMTDRTFRVYTHDDTRGVELGGALKNVLAIGGGISDGLGFGDNTKAALMTRGLMEMTQLGVATGAKAVTFLGLSGVGDLMATASSLRSRNYRVGLGLAQGKTIDEILTELHQAAEGIPTARAAQVLSTRLKVEVPVFSTLYEVIHEGKSPLRAVEDLMCRDARSEFGE